MDPIAEDFPHVTAYNYAENRVPVGIDLWGLQFYDPNSGASGPLDVNINDNKSTVIDEFASKANKMVTAILPTLNVVGEADADSDGSQSGLSVNNSQSQTLDSNPEQALGLSMIGFGAASMEKMIDVAADMQSNLGTTHVYGKSGGIAKGIFRGVGIVSVVPSAIDLIQSYNAGDITINDLIFESTILTISTAGIHGAAFGLGAETARYLNTKDWYREVRGRD